MGWWAKLFGICWPAFDYILAYEAICRQAMKVYGSEELRTVDASF
jgi:hypothetical protein